MTAKESLHEVVDEMTEAEAARLLEQVRPESAPQPRSNNAALLQLIEKWREENQGVSEEEIAEYDHMLANLEPVRFREWHPE